MSAAIAALILVAHAFSLLAPFDRFLSDRRFGFSDRAASGDIVFVAIDKQSLDGVGVWPWPRTIHAEITDRLRLLGASDITFDIDFSTPSTPENDAAFAAAIKRAGGTVTLPVFLQYPDGGEADQAPVGTGPTPMLAEWAWLATVNVFPEADGHVRDFPRGLQIGDNFVASIPATLAADASGETAPIGIDFGIDPASVPAISAIDLLNGDVAAETVEGRSVVVGAYATELRDFYSVPKHGFIAGPLLQVLAAETLKAERSIAAADSVPIDLAIFALLGAVLFALRRRGAVAVGIAVATLSLAIEAGAVLVYARHAIMVPTAFAHVAGLAVLGVHALVTSDFFRTLLEETAAEARNTRHILEKVVHENFDAIVVVDDRGRVLEASDAVKEIFATGDRIPARGAAAEDFLPDLIAADVAAAFKDMQDGTMPTGETKVATHPAPDGTLKAIEYTIGLSHLDTGPAKRKRRGSGPERIVACLTARDITDRLVYESRLKELSERDDMTGAWRRHAFLDATDRCFAQAEENDGFTIVAVNLHRFKTVNIALGREAGNTVLRGVVNRLRSANRKVAGPARLGGDTFAILIGDIEDETDAQFAAEEIAEAVTAPYHVGRGAAQIGVQAGVALWLKASDGGEGAEEVLDRAEMALDEARRAGGSRIMFFDKGLAEQRRRARVIERDLWGALERDELSLHYQLQVGIKEGEARGAEALMRWTHPEIGHVSPAEFTAIAEANGSITALGRWALLTACREAASWPESLTVAVNVAPQHMASDTIVSDVEVALAQSGLDPARLTVELVESEMMETDGAIEDRIAALRKLGVSLALDDFGTGYSGIGYLSRLRFDKIKVDRQFTMALETDVEAQAIVRSVAMLGEAFGMTVVCEGVETAEQESLLRLIGCAEGQGYYYSRPVDAESFRALVTTGDHAATVPLQEAAG